MDGPNVKLGPFFKFMAYYKLSEILTLIGGGTPKTTNPSYWGGNIPWLSVVDFNNDNRYVHTTEKTITEEGVENSSTKILPQSSLILSARGTVGALAQLAKPMAFNQSCYGIIAKEQTTNDFLYYLLKNVVEDLQAKGHGSVFNTITRDTFDTITVDLPPLEEQKRIAEILGSLDDKIELLQKQNKTLEEMAKALFKSWFVDFDVVRAKQKGLPKADIMREYHLTEELYDLFPSSFADSPLGPIPSGWEVKTLGDVVVCHDSKRVPLSNRERSEKQGPYPYYGATSIMDHVENYLFDGIFLLLGEDGSVVKPDGTPFLQYVFGKIWVNNHAHVLQGKGNIRTEYLYLFLSDVQIQPYVTGAVQAKLNQKNMNSIPLCVANEEIIKIFQGNIDIVFTKIRANLKQIQTLTELRDTLLPRLISGRFSMTRR